MIDLKVSFDNTESKLKPFEDQLKLSKHNINEINDEDSGDEHDVSLLVNSSVSEDAAEIDKKKVKPR